MATRGNRDGGKRNISSSDSSIRDSTKEKKTSAKPDSKKGRQEIGKGIGKVNDDQTSIKQFTDNIQTSAQSDSQSVMSQLTVSSENMIKKEDLKYELKNYILAIINDRMEELELRIFTLEVRNDQLEKQNKTLKDKCNKLECDVKSAVFSSNVALGKINDLEQYTRKSSVRVFGVTDENKQDTPEQSIEATMGVFAKIGADVKRSDIVIAHRVVRFEQGRYRPIIVRFTSNTHKDTVIYQPRKLKGTGIGISNDLTTKNMAYLKKLQIDERVSAAWKKGRKEMFYLTTHSAHFIYGYMASHIW